MRGRIWSDTSSITFHFSFFNESFFDDHHRDVIFDRIDEGAFGVDAFERRAVRLQLNLRLTLWAAKDLEEFGTYCHRYVGTACVTGRTVPIMIQNVNNLATRLRRWF